MTSTRIRSILLLTALAAAPCTVAQAPLFPADTLIGWSQGTPGQITAQRPAPACSSAVVCNNVLGTVAQPWSGGIAYDPRHQAAWVSNGRGLQLRDLRNPCDVLCGGQPHFAMQGTEISGLTLEDAESRLWQLETMPGFYAIVSYDVSDAPATCARLRSVCSLPLSYPCQTQVATGIAFDEARNLLYVVVQCRSTNSVIHYLHVSHASNPCNVICRMPIRHLCAALGEGVQGMAYDAATQRLYMTERNNVFAFSAVDPLNCDVRPLSGCCPAAAPYRGLAYVNGWRLDTHGSSCYASVCRACPSLRAVTAGGDPSIGNPAFALRVAGADPGQPAVALIRLGGCAPGGVPFACGTLFAVPPTVAFVHTTAGGACAAGASQPLPIPPSDTLIGLRICGQWGVLCSVDPFGLALTNAVDFAITGS